MNSAKNRVQLKANLRWKFFGLHQKVSNVILKHREVISRLKQAIHKLSDLKTPSKEVDFNSAQKEKQITTAREESKNELGKLLLLLQSYWGMMNSAA